MTYGKEHRRFTRGPYKGTVINNIDPLNMGRLLVSVPDVLGDDPCLWAEPATPLAGPLSGIYTTVQPLSGVWVEFVNGDPEYPVWTGSYRGSAEDQPPEVALAAPGVPIIVLGTPHQNAVVLNDTPGPTGGVLIQHQLASGQLTQVSINDSGIELSLGPAGPGMKITATGIELSLGPGGPAIELSASGITVTGKLNVTGP